jgi:hypothetical protein
MKDRFEVDDLILLMLKLPDPTPVKIVLTDKHVFLYVGPRDWQWDRETGEKIGAGTSLCDPFDGPEPPQVKAAQ